MKIYRTHFYIFGISSLLLATAFAVVPVTSAQNKFFATPNRGIGGARGAAQIKMLMDENVIRRAESVAAAASMTAISACGSQGMIYGPTHPGADATGCVTVSVPPDAVMAFNSVNCPSGWSPLAGAQGRVIIGTGSLGADGYGLGATGGTARHTLTVNEMPNHSHTFSPVAPSNASPGVSGGVIAAWSSAGSAGTSAVGGSQSHENRPPYLALLYCQKD